MQVILKGVLLQVTKTVQTMNKNSDTVEMCKQSHILTIEAQSTKYYGSTLKEICTVMLNENLLDKYKELEGQTVEIPCTLYSNHPIAIYVAK